MQLSTSSPDSAFELVDVLVANAQNAVQMICESIGNRILTLPEKGKKQTLNPNLYVHSTFYNPIITGIVSHQVTRTDAIVFKFLEEYLRRLENPLAVQVWSRYIQLVKDILAASKDFKTSNFYALRFLFSLNFFMAGTHIL